MSLQRLLPLANPKNDDAITATSPNLTVPPSLVHSHCGRWIVS